MTQHFRPFFRIVPRAAQLLGSVYSHAASFVSGRWKAAYPAVFSLAIWLCCTTILLAQEEKEEEVGKSWVMSYILVAFLIGLGLFVICRMGKRRNPKIRRRDEEDEE